MFLFDLLETATILQSRYPSILQYHDIKEIKLSKQNSISKWNIPFSILFGNSLLQQWHVVPGISTVCKNRLGKLVLIMAFKGLILQQGGRIGKDDLPVPGCWGAGGSLGTGGSPWHQGRTHPTGPARSKGRQRAAGDSPSPGHPAPPWGQSWAKEGLEHWPMGGGQRRAWWGEPGWDAAPGCLRPSK